VAELAQCPAGFADAQARVAGTTLAGKDGFTMIFLPPQTNRVQF
jgi:hypothetical protein